MLDKKTMALLQAINDLCVNGTYEILTVEDILGAMPKKFRGDDKFVREHIEELAEQKLVSVKYSDEHEFCLAPLPDGKMKCETTENNDNYDVKKATRKCAFVSFFGAVIGAFLGGVAVYLLVHFLGL